MLAENPTDYYNKGTKYLNAKNYAKALQFIKKEPAEFKEKYLNMGNALRGLGRINEAEECYLRAAAHDMPTFAGKFGEYPLALNNLGLMCHRRGDDVSAIKFYDASGVENIEAMWNKSVAMLRMGCSGLDIDWDLAWNLYELRFQKGTHVDKAIRYLGGECAEVTVLAEQGYGDKFMFWRYLWALRAECGGDVFVQCSEDLWDFVRGIGFEPILEVRGRGIPVCSLAWRYGLNVNGKYLDSWEGGSGIGVIWSGSKTHANNSLRSCPSGYFRKLRDFDNVVSLNPGISLGRDIPCVVDMSWDSKVKVLSGLKLVVTVDTAIVHLCGVVGTPCLMLQPLGETDFRWGNAVYKENTFDNVWYDNVSVLNHNGWEEAWSVIPELVNDYYKA